MISDHEKEYELCCDFGYDITSPIPSVEPVHKNSHSVVPAVIGTTAELFPDDPERYEFAEFVSFLTDEEKENTGIRCRIGPSPELLRFFPQLEATVWEVDLLLGKAVFADDNNYSGGKNTHTYRRLLLQEKEPAAETAGSETHRLEGVEGKDI